MSLKKTMLAGIILSLFLPGMALGADVLEKKLGKCLVVASYHDEFEGQALKIKGIRIALQGKCEIRQFNMDTKRNPDPASCRQKALEAKALVESWQPDIIIAVDDNASKYFVEPYFKNAKVPVVFCGLDWTADEYGYPYANATGVIEVFPIIPLVNQIKRILPDARSAVCIRGDLLSEQKDCYRYKEVYKTFGIDVVDTPVHTFDEFKAAFIKGQQSDFVIFQNYSGIQGFDDTQAKAFIFEHSKTLVVSLLSWMADFSMLAVTQIIEEQGEYAAGLALKILEGADPGEIPVMANRKWDVYVNETLLEKTKITLPPDLLHKAIKVRLDVPAYQKAADKTRKKCLFVASYHRGYHWQDRLEKGLRQVLEGQCDLLQFNMDTKRNPAPEFCRRKALEARSLIQSWKPDIVIASDDNASEYLIAPYFRDTALPVVFCGVNWTAEEYGYPYPNITGMIEVSPLQPLVRYVRQIIPDVGSGVCLFPSHLTETKSAHRYKEVFENAGIMLSLVTTDSPDEFESQYKNAQAADVIVLINNSTLKGWDGERVERVIADYSKKLTVTTNQWMMPYTMLGLTSVPEEQGEYAARAALRILQGAKPSDIPIVSNRKWNTYINKNLLEKAGISLPDEILQQAQEFSQ